MLVLHAHAGFGIAAHGIHYAIVGGGILGLVALLSPQFLTTPQGPRDEHEARVLALRATLARQAGPGSVLDPTDGPTHGPTHDPAQDRRPAGPALTVGQRLLLPLVAVSSAAAAGAHAAVGPEHLRESALFGSFFAGCALLQLLWSARVAVHSSWRLLVAGAVGNLAVIGLWAVTRTLGLPFGLLPGPEALGLWDLACVAWELVVVCGCIAILQSPDPLPGRLVGWRTWHPALPTFVAGSVILLLALSVIGAG